MFREIVRPQLTTARSDQAFDNIAHFNRMKFLGVLRTLEGYDGPVVAMLKGAAMLQLETLSCCIGARPL